VDDVGEVNVALLVRRAWHLPIDHVDHEERGPFRFERGTLEDGRPLVHLTVAVGADLGSFHQRAPRLDRPGKAHTASEDGQARSRVRERRGCVVGPFGSGTDLAATSVRRETPSDRAQTPVTVIPGGGRLEPRRPMSAELDTAETLPTWRITVCG